MTPFFLFAVADIFHQTVEQFRTTFQTVHLFLIPRSFGANMYEGLDEGLGPKLQCLLKVKEDLS